MDTLQLLSAKIEESAKVLANDIASTRRRQLLLTMIDKGDFGPRAVHEFLEKADQANLETVVREAIVNAIVGVGTRMVSRRQRDR